MSLFPRLKPKLFPVLLLVIFSFSFVFASPAMAQGLPTYDNTQNMWNTWNETKAQLEENWNKVEDNFIDSVMVGAMKGLDFLLNKVAYDMAVSLASGNWGQSPLFNTKSMGDYWAGVAGDALGTALDSFAKGVGFNLCSLPDPKLDLALKMGLHLAYSEPKPTCSFQQLKDTYSAENIKSKYWGENGEGFSKRFNTSLEISDTDLGIGIEAKSKMDSYALDAEAAAKAERTEGGGVKSLTTAISGDIITPAEVNKDMLVKAGKGAQVEGKKQSTQEYMAAALQKGSIQVLMNAASTFIDTFAGTAMDNFLTKGMFPFGLGKVKCVPSYLKIGGLSIDTCVESKYDAEGNYYAGGESSYKQEAASLFAELLLVAKSREISKYDLLSKFSSCPDNPGVENCVIDEQFAQAIRSAELGQPLTIRGAIEKGYLDENWKLIGPGEATERQHSEKDCYAGAFCYKNIKLLRKAGVLPLGFEIASLTEVNATNTAYANGVNVFVSGPPTLKEILENFDNVRSPYYHLINPNWVLKIPPARCKSLVYGTQLVDKDTPVRQEECADLQTCVDYDKNGKCLAYGYCLKEKSVWRFDADYCDSQYATCKVLTNSKGKTSSYLTRTLNSEMCDSDNVGCIFYSNFKTYPNSNFASGTWDYGKGKGFYLNKKTETCQAKDAGCTALALNTSTESNVVYFKKAPDYLGCYDSDNNRSNGVQWPQNLADFNKIKPVSTDACKNYSPVCLPEEERCGLYQTLNFDGLLTGESVTGKFVPATVNSSNVVTAWNDQCDASCVGYNSYKEMPTKYGKGTDLAYIIPQKEASCSASESGCSAFVNLSTVSNNLEQTEYFTDLRTCILPDKNRQKNFYTYEGRDAGGYQLISYVLLKESSGAPKQMYRDTAERDLLRSKCSQTAQDFNFRTDDGEQCRELIDDTGKKYYVFLNKTVAVSDKCTSYRAVKPEFDTGTDCLGSINDGGDKVVFYDVNTGYCVYNGLPSGIQTTAGGSFACAKEKVSCRPYKGNTGNYSNTLMNQTFEGSVVFGTDNQTQTWGKANPADSFTSLSVSTESLINNGHSLKVVVNAGGASGTKYYALPLTPGKSYRVSFLAKGSGSWGLRFWHLLNNNVADFTLTDNWKRYEYVFEAVKDANADAQNKLTAQLVLKPNTVQSQILYVDNVKVELVSDIVYLVKDKLTVPSLCDADQTDNLPGQALGCRAYKTTASLNPVYLHNFSYLCRDGAQGCTKVYDTNNRELAGTDSKKYIVYNLWLKKSEFGTPGVSGELSTTVGGVSLKCFAAKEENGCYVEKIVAPSGALSALSEYYTTATIVIPPRSESPIYLVLKDQNVSCAEAEKGCTALGSSVLLSDDSRKYQDVYLKIKPNTSDFDNSICNDKAEGCDSWKSGSSNYYFKDPEIYGNLICEWKKDDTGVYKWLMKGTTSTICYADNSAVNGSYLPSYGSDNYANYTGVCPADQSDCTLFTDRYSESQSKKCAVSGKKCQFDKDCTSDAKDVCSDPDKEYYLINNSKISDAQKDCSGKVSLNSGCVLFDKTDNPTKTWDTAATYAASNAKGGALVDPINNASTNDANIVMKVMLDRTCSLWSYCSEYMTNRDGDTGQLSSRCYRLGLCTKAQAGATSDGQCVDIVTSTSEKDIPLTKKVYQSRSTAWNAEEFTGYSLFNSYQIYDLQVREIKYPSVSGLNGIPLIILPENKLVHTEVTTTVCNVNDVISSKKECSSAKMPGLKGYCSGEECVFPAMPYSSYDLDATEKTDVMEDPKASPGLSCRGYPEQDSPFNLWVLRDSTATGVNREFKKGFSDKVNLCSGGDCDCSYKKYNYKSQNVYLGSNAVEGDYAKGVCLGGLEEGKGCDPTVVNSCGDENSGGICSPLKSINALLGWEGYCVEKDVRNPFYTAGGTDNTCLTWWPVESVEGATDLYVYDDTAGWRVTEKTPLEVCAYNNPVKNSINNTSWACSASNIEPYKYAQKLNSYISHASGDPVREWYVKGSDFRGEGEKLEPLNSFGGTTQICGNDINGKCENPSPELCSNSDNGQKISWQGNYMYPYYIQGKKFGCERNNDDAGIEGVNGQELLIKNLSPNSTAYYIYASDDNEDYSIPSSDSDVVFEKIDRKSITKIEVLVSDSVKEGIENNFDNNRFTFYNGEFFELNTKNDNLPDAFKDSDGGYFVSSTYFKPSNTCYQKLTGNDWGLQIWGVNGNINCEEDKYKEGSNGFTVKIKWTENGILDGLSVETKDVRGTYEKHSGDITNCNTIDGGDENGSRGNAFIFIVHYSDGTCSADNSDKIIVRDNTDVFSIKPVTWRLIKDKVFLFNNSNDNQPSSAAYSNSYKYRTIYARREAVPSLYYGLTNGEDPKFLNSFRKYFNFWDADNQQPFGLLGNSGSLNGGVALINYDSKEAKQNDLMDYGTYENGEIYTYKYRIPLNQIAADCSKNIPFENVLPDGDNSKKNDSPICNMFRKMFVKGWVGSAGLKVDFASPKAAKDLGIKIRPPVIAAPVKMSKEDCDIKIQKCKDSAAANKFGCEAEKVCNSFVLDQMSVTGDNVTGKDIQIAYGQPLILRFYAWADPAQMPLRSIWVKKNISDVDFVKVEAESMGNRKPKCTNFGYCVGGSGTNWSNADDYKYQIPCDGDWDCVFYNESSDNLVEGKCQPQNQALDDDPEGFGNNRGEGCRADYYEFYLNIANTNITYKPAVQVKDNWGWCSGKCDNTTNYPAGYNGIGCYSEIVFGSNTFNDCDSSNKAWKEYNGGISVK
ncbi:MAG TPA: hypothetical protein P5230_01365 [Candidatus Magasanikbacteria bacterium]|nr:hypothetical protein [Candidatus Magasanikbacteria bacterium]